MIHPQTWIGLKVRPTVKERMNIELIKSAVLEATGVDMSDIISKSRHQVVKDARHLFHYYVRKHTDLSTSAIGKLTHRDHSTIIHSTKTVNRMKEHDSYYIRKMDNIQNILRIKTISDYGKLIQPNTRN